MVSKLADFSLDRMLRRNNMPSNYHNIIKRWNFLTAISKRYNTYLKIFKIYHDFFT